MAVCPRCETPFRLQLKLHLAMISSSVDQHCKAPLSIQCIPKLIFLFKFTLSFFTGAVFWGLNNGHKSDRNQETCLVANRVKCNSQLHIKIVLLTTIISYKSESYPEIGDANFKGALWAFKQQLIWKLRVHYEISIVLLLTSLYCAFRDTTNK